MRSHTSSKSVPRFPHPTAINKSQPLRQKQRQAQKVQRIGGHWSAQRARIMNETVIQFHFGRPDLCIIHFRRLFRVAEILGIPRNKADVVSGIRTREKI